MTETGRPKPPEADWKASWRETRRRQMSMGLDATAAQRLEWLEEAIRLAHSVGALPRKRTPEAGGRRRG